MTGHGYPIAAAVPYWGLFLAEGLAIGAFGLGGVHFMGTHLNAVEGAVVLTAAVMGAGPNGAFDTFVGMAIHKLASFIIGFYPSMSAGGEIMQEKDAKFITGLKNDFPRPWLKRSGLSFGGYSEGRYLDWSPWVNLVAIG